MTASLGLAIRPDRPEFSVVVPVAPERDPLVMESLDGLSPSEPTCEVVVEHGPNPSRNRNVGIQRAQAEILAFTDDDCVVRADWLVAAAAFFRDHPDYDAVGGPQLNLEGETLLGRATGYALGSPFGTFHSYRRYCAAAPCLRATQLDLTSANLFVRREAFEKWGPFDERLWPNEETALLRAIELGDGKIAYDPSIVVYHKRRASLWQLARQCFGYGRGRARQSRLEGARWLPGLGQAVPCAFLAYLLLLPVLVSVSGLSIFPLFAYSVVTMAASVVIAWRNRDLGALPLMPLAFFAVHVSYPAGFVFESLWWAKDPEASESRILAAVRGRPDAWAEPLGGRRTVKLHR